MPSKCSVNGCKTNYDSELKKNTIKNNTMFTLPKDKALRDIWIANIPNGLLHLKTAYICIKHFVEQDIIRNDVLIYKGEFKMYPRKIPKLRKGAYPQVFPAASYSFPHNQTSRKININPKSFVKRNNKETLVKRNNNETFVKRNNNETSVDRNCIETSIKISTSDISHKVNSPEISKKAKNPEISLKRNNTKKMSSIATKSLRTSSKSNNILKNKGNSCCKISNKINNYINTNSPRISKKSNNRLKISKEKNNNFKTSRNKNKIFKTSENCLKVSKLSTCKHKLAVDLEHYENNTIEEKNPRIDENDFSTSTVATIKVENNKDYEHFFSFPKENLNSVIDNFNPIINTVESVNAIQSDSFIKAQWTKETKFLNLQDIIHFFNKIEDISKAQWFVTKNEEKIVFFSVSIEEIPKVIGSIVVKKDLSFTLFCGDKLLCESNTYRLISPDILQAVMTLIIERHAETLEYMT